MSHTPFPLRLQVPSQPRYLAVVRAAIETALLKHGVVRPEIDRVILAVDEAVCNVMRHGYKGRNDGPIWISLRVDVESSSPTIEVIIEDETDADPQSIKPRAKQSLDVPGGLGVNIMHRAMDEVSCTKRDGGTGVRVTMKRALHATDLDHRETTAKKD